MANLNALLLTMFAVKRSERLCLPWPGLANLLSFCLPNNGVQILALSSISLRWGDAHCYWIRMPPSYKYFNIWLDTTRHMHNWLPNCSSRTLVQSYWCEVTFIVQILRFLFSLCESREYFIIFLRIGTHFGYWTLGLFGHSGVKRNKHWNKLTIIFRGSFYAPTNSTLPPEEGPGSTLLPLMALSPSYAKWT